MLVNSPAFGSPAGGVVTGVDGEAGLSIAASAWLACALGVIAWPGLIACPVVIA
jgi:hypothetical protein